MNRAKWKQEMLSSQNQTNKKAKNTERKRKKDTNRIWRWQTNLNEKQ